MNMERVGKKLSRLLFDPNSRFRRPSESFPDRVRTMANGFIQAKVILLGIELGLFEALASGATTAEEVAARRGLTPRGTAVVLDALTALGFLLKDPGGRYANSAETARYLLLDGPDSIAHILGHNNTMFSSWARLDEIVRGTSVQAGSSPSGKVSVTLRDKAANRNFILGMAEVSRHRVAAMAEALPLAGARRFVDLGGGPAQYACAAARRYPELECVLVDLPLTVDVAREYIASQGLSGRVRTVVCDFYHAPELDAGGPADVVLISQVLHAEGPDENRALLRKVAPHVRPGGWVVVAEHLVEPSRTAPESAALFAVNMLAGTERGCTYTEEEIASWLGEAGLETEPARMIADRTWLIRSRKP